MMKIELPCSVITDLLPLYQDGLCSPESKEIIEAHLQTCKNCRALCSELPLPEAEPPAVPDEAEAFRQLRKKTRRGKLLRIMSICASVLLVCFLVLNAIWFPAKYFPYKSLCKNFDRNPDGGKGDEYTMQSGDYVFRMNMPDYLSFEGGFLSVEPASRKAILAATALEPIVYGEDARTGQDEIPQSLFEPEPGILFIWPQPFGETKFGIMICQRRTPQLNESLLFQFYISKDLEFLDTKNTRQDDTPEEIQQKHEIYAAHLDEARELMDAAKKQWPELF